MHIAVCVKPVPDPKTADKVTIDPVTKRIRREGSELVINQLDKNAIELAVSVKEQVGGEVSVFSMAIPTVMPLLTETLALGGDAAYLLTDRAFGGGDSIATTNVLAAGLNKVAKDKGIKWDLIVFGAYSSDGGTAQVPTQVGEWLDIPNFHFVSKFECKDGKFHITSDYGDKYLEWECPAPAVVSVTRDVNKPRYTSIRGLMQAKKKQIVTLTAADVDVDQEILGLKGSPTHNGDMNPIKASRACKKLSGSSQEIASQLLDILSHSGVAVSAKK